MSKGARLRRMSQHPTRRRFLESLAVGSAATLGLDRLVTAQTEFDAHLAQDPAPFDDLRKDYTLDEKVTYLNHASIGTIPSAVQEARAKYLAACETNPWLHMWGGAWDAARERTRHVAAEVLGCHAAEVVINHNTTEGFNVLAAGLGLGEGDEVLFSNLNHPGASHCWTHWSAQRGYTVRHFDIPLSDVPEMTRDDIVAAHINELSPQTRVLVLPHIDNTVGLRHPVKEIAKLARAAGVRYIAVDGAQAVGMVPVDVAAMGIDFYATSPHKWLQAPKGIGLMYVRKEVQRAVRALWVTWGQQRWKGSVRVLEDYGTRNLAEVLALGDAIDYQQRLGAKRKEARLRELWQYFRAAVAKEPKVVWRSPNQWELGSSLYAIEVPGHDSRKVAEKLWPKHGIVLRAFHSDGLNTLRISPNVFNTTHEIDRFFSLLRTELS